MMLGCVLACPERGDDLVQPVVACWLCWSALVDEKRTARPQDVWSTYYARPKIHAINLKHSSPPHDITTMDACIVTDDSKHLCVMCKLSS
jgi:hypothetical protein